MVFAPLKGRVKVSDPVSVVLYILMSCEDVHVTRRAFIVATTDNGIYRINKRYQLLGEMTRLE